MKHIMNKLGIPLGLCVVALAASAIILTPSSCTLTPEQAAKVQSITVPLSAIGLGYAQSQGWIEPGDKILVGETLAVVTSAGDSETKVRQLTELGLSHAIDSGLISPGDVITVKSPEAVSIASPQPSPITGAKEHVPTLLPPAGG